MTQPLHVRAASTSFWLSSLNQQIAVLAVQALNDGFRAYPPRAREEAQRLKQLASGFALTFDGDGMAKEKAAAESFRRAVVTFAEPMNSERITDDSFALVRAAFRKLADEELSQYAFA